MREKQEEIEQQKKKQEEEKGEQQQKGTAVMKIRRELQKKETRKMWTDTI